ncbi:6-carboxytetrahydropterin synthase QueD [Bacillus salacetis]|uniref:6-carboxy-5,6,7,8-tetrahydropterin synthase n=1 Tax=Bacillus salacetis TaxID=2315464 RepID=A0A3A1R1Y4_9BACI|nr:6-carboxytetrahydropterin synthase QueD [Bacillus salacetis]RIW35071.1 6-carboxytetrahydropterin synthase QueD [Bacillus salacetis]
MIGQIYPVPEHPFSYELNKDFQFAAAHFIPSESAGKCRKIHGHTYFANVTIGGDELDDSGFLFNFAEIKKLIHDRFDHTILNEDPLFSEHPERYPTTEVMAEIIYGIIQDCLNEQGNHAQCLQVFLRETPTSYCIFRPGKDKFQ